MATNTKTTDYQLHLKGFVGGYDFDVDYVDYILNKNKDSEVHVLIDSLGGRSNTALSIFSAFKRHGNVNVHFVGMNASAATIASLGALFLLIIQISIVSPSLLISQKGMPFSSVNSFMRQADSKPLATKCMGTKRPTLKRSMNCRPPRV